MVELLSKFYTDKPKGKKLLGRSRCIRNIKEIGINTRNLLDSAQDRDYWRALVNQALSLWAL